MAKKKKPTPRHPRKLSESQQAWLDAWINAPVDRKALEAECRELLRLDKEGKLIPMEQVLRELFPNHKKAKKKPA